MRIWRNREKESGGTNGYGKYSWSAVDSSKFKQYVISDKYYTKFGGRITAPVISLKEGSSGSADRFYVMALEDITYNYQNTFYWLKNNGGDLDKTITRSTNDFGKGKEYTIYDMNSIYVTKDSRDIWKVLKESAVTREYPIVTSKTDSGKWFVPSKAEWAAFGDYMFTNQKMTTSNYSSYGLTGDKGWYWSSAQSSKYNAYRAYFYNGYVDDYSVQAYYALRLSATF